MDATDQTLTHRINALLRSPRHQTVLAAVQAKAKTDTTNAKLVLRSYIMGLTNASVRKYVPQDQLLRVADAIAARRLAGEGAN